MQQDRVEPRRGSESSVAEVACRAYGKCLSGQPGQGEQVKCSLRKSNAERWERAWPYMELMESARWAEGATNREGIGARLPRAEGTMESQTYCAYNQTRECFLGLKVKAGDFSAVSHAERVMEKPLRSGEGVWMKPFREIPATAMPAPLDLIYLDEECRVIDMAESIPTVEAGPTIPRLESVLALPAHSIYSSQTQSGDQLVLCVAEEMERQLERLTNRREEAATGIVIAGAALLREKPLWGGGPGLLELEDRNGQNKPEVLVAHMMDLAPPDGKSKGQPEPWFERWWSPDPRKAPRVKETGPAAYYWNGAASVAQALSDANSTGLYVVTEERWYPATLVLMTVRKTEWGQESVERSIAVQSRAVRRGPDSVGLKFFVSGPKDMSRGRTANLDATSARELECFLRRLTGGI